MSQKLAHPRCLFKSEELRKSKGNPSLFLEDEEDLVTEAKVILNEMSYHQLGLN